MHRLDLLTQYLAVGTVFQLLGILVLSFYFGAYGALVGYLIGVSVPCLLLFELIVAEPEIDKDMSIRLVSYARMRWLSELAAAFVFSRVEIFFLQYYWGADAVGFFTVSLTLSNLAVQGPLMLTWGFLPHFSAQFAQRHLEGIQTSYAAGTRLLAFMVFPACVGLAAITPELLPILFGDQFAAAITPAQILVCAASLSASATVGANLIWAMERTDADLYINLFGAVISILCGFLLIGPFGVYGAAYSRAATQVVVIGLGTWFVHRKLGIKVPFKSLCLLFGCAAAAGFVARISVNVFAGMVGIVLAICCAAVTYFALTFLCGALTAHDRAQIYRIYSRVTSSILSRFPSDQT